MGQPVMLSVDDDPTVSRAIARDLRQRYGSSYRVRRAESGADALAALRELALRNERVGLLLADQRMPNMDGVQFLREARAIFPSARRVLLTAYADTEAAIAAINEADVHYFLAQAVGPARGPPVPGHRRPPGGLGGRRATVLRRRSGDRPPLLRPGPRGQGLPRPEQGAVPRGSTSRATARRPGSSPPSGPAPTAYPWSSPPRGRRCARPPPPTWRRPSG
ncbi:MAG TPA: response regulator [Acidimicrobiales bacterium]|nr:response regulator [Acidimicrobiales bacterium]